MTVLLIFRFLRSYFLKDDGATVPTIAYLRMEVVFSPGILISYLLWWFSEIFFFPTSSTVQREKNKMLILVIHGKQLRPALKSTGKGVWHE